MSETILGGYPKISNLQKSRIKRMTANQQILEKMPYTIKLSAEPQRTMLYNIWCRCHTEKNNSFLTTIGTTGSGKSYTNIYFGYMLDVDKEGNHLLDPENIIFDPSKFVDKAFNPSHIGEFIMKDEIEMDANSRSSFSKLNRIICDVISTVRYKRGIIFFNLPTEQQLDIQILRLRFGNIICDEVAKDGTYSKFHFEYTQGAKKRDDKYTPDIKRTRLFNQKFIGHPLYERVMSKVEYEYLKLYLPVQRAEFRFLLKDYDKRKNEYLKEKYEMFRAELNTMNVKEKEKENDAVLLEKYLKTMEKHKDHFCPNGKKASVSRIQSEFKVTITKAKLIASEFNNVSFPVVQKKEAKKERSDFLKELLNNKKGIVE